MNPNTIEDAFSGLPGAAGDMIEGGGEYLIWRHQQVGNRRVEADNAMGSDPGGTTWETDDRYVEAAKQGLDFYGQFVPVQGDLLVRLAGAPDSKASAQNAREIGYYRVVGVNVRRTKDGKVAHVKIETEADRSGQWSS